MYNIKVLHYIYHDHNFQDEFQKIWLGSSYPVDACTAISIGTYLRLAEYIESAK